MSRATVVVDRFLTLLLALLVGATGVALLVWWSGRGPAAPSRLDLSAAADLERQTWFPWALGAFGIVLVLLGLRWLASHLPDRGVTHLNLAGSGSGGRLVVAAGPLAAVVAETFQETPGVRSARGAIQRDRGQVVARVNAVVEGEADLRLVAAAAERASAQLQQALQRDDLHCLFRLRVAARSRSMPRVH